jgi:hypothetical protein
MSRSSCTYRWVVIACIVAILGLNVPAHCQTPQASKQTNTRRNNPKCGFLREETHRLQQDHQAFVEASEAPKFKSIEDTVAAGKSADDLAEFVALDEIRSAKIRIMTLNVASCDKAQPLSDVDRLPSIDLAKQKQISQIPGRWTQLGGKSDDPQVQAIVSRVNGVYDEEAKSFYNTDAAKLSLDPEIVKDYPTLFSMIQSSGLTADQKAFFQQNAQFLKYEEAGRLFNILSGADKVGSLSYAYSLRKPLTERAQVVQSARQANSQKATQEIEKRIGGVMVWVGIGVAVLIAILAAVIVFKQSERFARYKGIRDKEQMIKYWWGTKTLILWEPGEVVILLRNKKLVSMTESNGDSEGGFTSVSAWKGEEYRGRISYQSQLMQYVSEDIHTSDGIRINLDLGLWWQIQNPNLYVARIASDFHAGNQHHGSAGAGRGPGVVQRHFDEVLKETAERWIHLMAASSLREYICQLSAATLISPSVQTYIDTYFNPVGSEPKRSDSKMPIVLDGALKNLNDKTQQYGIRIERIEVNELKLPDNLKQKLETVRLSFLDPARISAETEGKTIAQRGLTQGQIEALSGFADVLGKDKVALIEIIKAIGTAKIPFVAPQAPPFAMLQSLISNAQTGSASAEPAEPRPVPPLIDDLPLDSEKSSADPKPPSDKPKSDAASAD